MSDHFEVVIIGGGTAGLTVAARLMASANPPSVAIIEPSAVHYYQPIWTLVGVGLYDLEASGRPTADFIPRGVTWVQDHASEIDPEGKHVTTGAGRTIRYEVLVVAAGIALDWGAIDGLAGNVGRDGICSNYSYDTVASTWDCIRAFEGGTALFTHPNTPIKCGGAPQKIAYLADDAFRRQGVRDASRVVFAKPGGSIFGVDKYRRTLEGIVEARGIETVFERHLVAVRPGSREAVLAHVSDGSEQVMRYDMLHVTPPQHAPDFLRQGPLADSAGWVDVDAQTLQHVRHPEVFSLGDCSNLPCAKTGAAVRKQAPVLVENLLAWRAGDPLLAAYGGYSSCPLVTGRGRVVLAEFGYEGKVMETFPFDQSAERFSMYLLKRYALPSVYWHGMLRGRL